MRSQHPCTPCSELLRRARERYPLVLRPLSRERNLLPKVAWRNARRQRFQWNLITKDGAEQEQLNDGPTVPGQYLRLKKGSAEASERLTSCCEHQYSEQWRAYVSAKALAGYRAVNSRKYSARCHRLRSPFTRRACGGPGKYRPSLILLYANVSKNATKIKINTVGVTALAYSIGSNGLVEKRINPATTAMSHTTFLKFSFMSESRVLPAQQYQHRSVLQLASKDCSIN